jgi:hypothetical protein
LTDNISEHYRIKFYSHNSVDDWRIAIAINAYKEVRYGNKGSKGRPQLPAWVNSQDLIHLAYETICEKEKSKPGQSKEYYKKRAIGELKDFLDRSFEYNEKNNRYPHRISFESINLNLEGALYQIRERSKQGGRKPRYRTQEDIEDDNAENVYYQQGDTVRITLGGDPVNNSLLHKQLNSVLPLPSSSRESFYQADAGEIGVDLEVIEITDGEIFEEYYQEELDENRKTSYHEVGQYISDYSLGSGGWHDSDYELARLSSEEQENWEFSSSPCFDCGLLKRCISMMARPIDKAIRFSKCSPKKIHLDDGAHKKVLELWLYDGYRHRKSGEPNYRAIARELKIDEKTVKRYYLKAVEMLRKKQI